MDTMEKARLMADALASLAREYAGAGDPETAETVFKAARDLSAETKARLYDIMSAA